jgi:hypothetical protein
VECGGTWVDAMTRLFDALEATRAFAACREGPARPGQGDGIEGGFEMRANRDDGIDGLIPVRLFLIHEVPEIVG